MTYYYDKDKDIFYSDDTLLDIDRTGFVTYTEEEYSNLWNYDEFHYVGQDPDTKLPKQFKINDEEEKNILRIKREQECYPIINRGQLWYSRLTDEQKQELDVWYTAWLDVTETKVIPERPSWLK